MKISIFVETYQKKLKADVRRRVKYERTNRTLKFCGNMKSLHDMQRLRLRGKAIGHSQAG